MLAGQVAAVLALWELFSRGSQVGIGFLYAVPVGCCGWWYGTRAGIEMAICMGSFDRLRSGSSCVASTERSPGARLRRREPRNGWRDAWHDPAPTAELVARIEAAESAGDLHQVNRLEAWLWLDGPRAAEGRVAGRARELFLDMNDRALQAEDPGEQAESPRAWPQLVQRTAPTLVMVGTLDHERIQTIDEVMAATIPTAQFSRLDGVAHLPHLEADPTPLDQIAQFVEGVGN